MNQKLAVLITCHNRKDHTLSCLQHLYTAANLVNNIKVDVYLVDDGSTDGTAEEIRSKYPLVNIVQGNGQLYWGGGMIKAWQTASSKDYDFYLWLNDDTYLKSFAIKEMLNDSASLKNQSIIAGVCEWKDSSSISYSGLLLKDKVLLKPEGVPKRCDYFNGNVVLVPKYVFHKVGFLDPVFSHYLGDTDYGMRAKNLGITSYISSNIVGKCDGHLLLSPWCNPDNPLQIRIKHFKSPLTKSPKQVFIFEKRHTSLVMALFRAGIIYIRLLFPTLWIIMGKKKLGEG